MTTGTTTTSDPGSTGRTREGAAGPLRPIVRQLLMAGFAPRAAVNLAGLAIGLRPTGSGWTIREIERLRFLRHLVATGRLAA